MAAVKPQDRKQLYALGELRECQGLAHNIQEEPIEQDEPRDSSGQGQTPQSLGCLADNGRDT